MSFASQLSVAFSPISAVYDAGATTQALAWAQAFVEGYCNRSFDLVTGDIAFIDPKPYRQALLPAIPVANVSNVQALLPDTTGTGGLTWTALTNYRFVADTGLLYDTTGEPGTGASFSCAPSWPWLPGSLQVTYDHGYSTVPTALINVAIRFAQQYLENPALLLQREVGAFNERYAGNTGGVGIVINEFDKLIMDRYTLISIA